MKNELVIVLDRSGSMNRRSGTGSRWTALQQAVNAFLDALEDIHVWSVCRDQDWIAA